MYALSPRPVRVAFLSLGSKNPPTEFEDTPSLSAARASHLSEPGHRVPRTALNLVRPLRERPRLGAKSYPSDVSTEATGLISYVSAGRPLRECPQLPNPHLRFSLGRGSVASRSTRAPPQPHFNLWLREDSADRPPPPTKPLRAICSFTRHAMDGRGTGKPRQTDRDEGRVSPPRNECTARVE